ncbi:hypothetical protein BDV98DRAFT_587268 [Pterulicium gracile]|uniref:Uncharacterized protein n=1 Tax=Pterulicium gracile TaxID=1884261 RepID=A0A5C3Q0T4_9AGAR|nr:hypothetical protein BDV98DRAFT_587268 [Pterula gracilis]
MAEGVGLSIQPWKEWHEYEPRMMEFAKDRTVNDRAKRGWIHPYFKFKLHPKGEGKSLMISDILVPEFGRLTHTNKNGEIEEARVLFRAGKNRDDIFEAKMKAQGIDAVALLLFDNATIHQKRAPDAL